MVKQVDISHYWTERYLCLERFAHYREQFLSIYRLSPSSVLEVGPGPGLLSAMIGRFCANVKTLDFADDVLADFHSNVTSMPLNDSSFDVVCAFQVLEHMPWDFLQPALTEMSRVCDRYVLFSVPNNSYMKKNLFNIRLELFGKVISGGIRSKCYHGLSNEKEHHWEIGVGSITSAALERVISDSNLDLIKQWMDGVDNFFLCKKINR